MNPWKAILYAQVPATENTNASYALIKQEKELREHCSNNNIEIVEFYGDISSASPLERSEFSRLLTFVEQNEGVADIILITTWGKIMSNFNDTVEVLHRMNCLSIYAEAIQK
jgi:DNA invertase Pin-like site-specific DNA recombinase